MHLLNVFRFRTMLISKAILILDRMKTILNGYYSRINPWQLFSGDVM